MTEDIKGFYESVKTLIIYILRVGISFSARKLTDERVENMTH